MIFYKPIAKLNIEDIKTFCEKGVKEGINLDYKEDFPSSKKLAKTISAFANTLGGVIIVGVEEDEENKPVLPIKGILFKRGLHEKVVNIILDNISPPLFPEIGVIRFKEENKEKAVVMIRVPQSNETPHTINNKKGICVRTDNRNKLEDVATLEEIEWLINRRRKSEELKNKLYQNTIKRLDNLYKKGFLKEGVGAIQIPEGQGIFSISPLYPSKSLTNPVALKNICEGHDLRVRDYFGTFDSFPYFNSGTKTTKNGVIDYLIWDSRDEGIETFYYEFNVFGLFFYQEIFGRKINEKTSEKDKFYKTTSTHSLWFYNVIARLDEFLEVASRFYDKIDVWGLVEIKIQFSKIFNIKIQKPKSFLLWYDNKVSHENNIEINKVVIVQGLKEKRIEILIDILKEIAWAFNYDIGDKFIKDYLKELKGLPADT